VVATKENAEELFGIEVFRGEDTEFSEDGIERILCLVHEEDRAIGGRGEVLGPSRAQSLETAPTIVRRARYGKQVAELSIEIGELRLRVLCDATKDLGEIV